MEKPDNAGITKAQHFTSRSTRSPSTCRCSISSAAIASTAAQFAAGWVHEIKHDGFRLQIRVRGQRVSLYTMTGVNWTERYPWIVEDMARLTVSHAVIDAQCVCDGDNGVTDFERPMARVYDASAYAYAFHLLAIDGDDLRAQPLSERKAALAKLLRRSKSGIRYSEHLTGDGTAIFEHACKLGLEGIVSKRINASYRSGKAKTWLKTKNPKAAAMLRVQESF